MAALLACSSPPPGPPATAPAVSGSAESGVGSLWLVAGGGSAPDSNQVSIERDVALAASVFGGSGTVLFAGGPGSHGVQIQTPLGLGDPLLVELGHIFDPRPGRAANYRPTEVSPSGPATREETLGTLERALAGGDAPFLLYIAGHGSPGRVPAENAVAFWGGDTVSAVDLVPILDTAPERQVRLVLTSCFSGGFAELVFEDANPRAGASEQDRCGFFASKWNQESSGCDPDPVRRNQEGYGVYFLNALRGQRRDGTDALSAIDLNGDGEVSLMEADSYARIHSGGIEVPTRTSEWWLRSVAPLAGPTISTALPEDEATLRGLRQRLGTEASLPAVRGRLAAIDTALTAHAWIQLRVGVREATLYREVGRAMLAVWPVLDDPYHPLFRPLLERERAAIRRFLDASVAYQEVREIGRRLDQLGELSDALRVQSAPLQRLLRAMDTRALAGLLRAKGGPDWERYRRLLACERGFAP